VSTDACPGVLRLHPAADGPLARVRLPGGRVDARGLHGLASAAEIGNGIVELTSRAGVQLRGIRDPEACAQVLGSAGLLPSATHERVRNIIASPVAGRHPESCAGTDALVAELDRQLCADPGLAALSERFLFAIDDGAGLVGHAADVTLVAAGHEAFRVAGREVACADAAPAALAQARKLMDGPPRSPAAGPVKRMGLGSLRQNDGRVALTVMPRLARLDPPTLRAVADLADDVRFSTARTLTVVDLQPEVVERTQAMLVDAGLIADPASGWVGLTACAGEGACAKARYGVRAAAARRAAERGAGGRPEHFAGCDRLCGRPEDAVVVRSG
jgi:precorrin-3B synthase